MRGVMFGMPPVYPNGVYMAFEMATYAFVIGLLYQKGTKKPVWYGYVCLITAQIFGRIVWGIGKVMLLGLGKNGFTFTAFIVGGFADALPGILMQLILIIPLVKLLEKLNVIEG